jgi:hypothetical protein
MKDRRLRLTNTNKQGSTRKDKINQAYPLGASAMKLTPLFSSLSSVLKEVLIPVLLD